MRYKMIIETAVSLSMKARYLWGSKLMQVEINKMTNAMPNWMDLKFISAGSLGKVIPYNMGSETKKLAAASASEEQFITQAAAFKMVVAQDRKGPHLGPAHLKAQ